MLEPKEFTLASGKKLVVNISSFELGIRLSQELLKCLKKSKIDLTKDLLSTPFDQLLVNGTILGALAQAFIEALTSDSLNEIFWNCAAKCSYDGLRITKELFTNNVEARGDYYQIQFLVVKENILPFFPQLHTALADQQR